MIAVDTNVIHDCWVRGHNTEVAQAVRRKDPDWHAPILWRSELRNVLTAYLRRKLMSRIQIAEILRIADRAFVESEHIVGGDLVLDVAIVYSMEGLGRSLCCPGTQKDLWGQRERLALLMGEGSFSLLCCRQDFVQGKWPEQLRERVADMTQRMEAGSPRKCVSRNS